MSGKPIYSIDFPLHKTHTVVFAICQATVIVAAPSKSPRRQIILGSQLSACRSRRLMLYPLASQVSTFYLTDQLSIGDKSNRNRWKLICGPVLRQLYSAFFSESRTLAYHGLQTYVLTTFQRTNE